MKIFTIIFGVLIAICGLSCIFTPLVTFLEAGYFLVILLFVYGTVGIIRSVSDKTYGIDFVFDILSIILGIVILVVPDLYDGILVYAAGRDQYLSVLPPEEGDEGAWLGLDSDPWDTGCAGWNLFCGTSHAAGSYVRHSGRNLFYRERNQHDRDGAVYFQ